MMSTPFRVIALLQMPIEKLERERESPVGFRLPIGAPPVPREGMIGVWILVDLDERVRREPPRKQVVDLGLHAAILHRPVQHEWSVSILELPNVVRDIGAVIGNRASDVGAAAQQVAKLAAEAVAVRADLAVTLVEAGKIVPGVLHVAHGEVVVEVVVEVEGLLYVLGVF